MIDVLIVDDSRVIRDYLVHLLQADPELRVIGTAVDGEEALAFVSEHRPDVILMDINMPRVDGLEVTRRIMMSAQPIPIVTCTSSSLYNETGTAMQCLEAGSLSLVKKPTGPLDPGAEAEAAELIRVVKAMAEVRLVRRWAGPRATPAVTSKLLPPLPTDRDVAVVAIGASTGGPPAILQLLSGLSPAFPAPILVVQHIARGFGAGFAEWLGQTSGLPVHVAQAGNPPLPGHVYVAPDDLHLRVGPRGELQTTKEEPHMGLRPAVGVLFRSVAERHGRRAVGVLLSGMGRDGAEELKLLSDLGATTIAQDEESCLVFGMPGEAVKLGAARYVLSPSAIAELLSRAARGGRG